MDQVTTTYVAMDTHKQTISVAIAEGGRRGETRFLGEISSRTEAVAKMIERLARKHAKLAFCYEAGPCGYGLYRQIVALGHECVVVAPSLVPTRPGDRVKTDRRDAVTQASLFRSGELTPVWVPDDAHEAMRDLCRTRQAAMEALRRARQQVLCVSCVDAPLDASVFSLGSGMWSGAFVCPASSCGSSHAAGLYGSTRIGSKSAWRARSAPKHTGFPDPVSLTVCPYPWIGLLTSPTSPTRDRRLKREPRQELGKPRLLSSAPRRSELCGSPAPPRRQGGAFSSTCVRARSPRERLCAKPIERRSSRR
jgi:hypothetical protein